MPQRQDADRHSAFVLSNPPLAALHNMTERKLPPAPSTTSANSSAPFMCPYSTSQKAQFAYAGLPSTPHGINDILGRPLGPFGQLGVSPLYLNTSAACYAAAAAAASTPLAELPGRPPVYWPGMLQPPAWRTSQGKSNRVDQKLWSQLYAIVVCNLTCHQVTLIGPPWRRSFFSRHVGLFSVTSVHPSRLLFFGECRQPRRSTYSSENITFSHILFSNHYV